MYEDPIDYHVHYLDTIPYEDEDARDRADLEAFYEEERKERDARQKEVERRGERHGKTNLGAIMQQALWRNRGK